MSTPVVNIGTIENVNWFNASSCTYTLNHSNNVWLIRISDHILQVPGLNALLSADERERAASYYAEKDRQRFIVSRAYLRTILGKYLNMAPGDVIFEVDENKKPHVKGAKHLNYNVSHSDNYILIGISDHALGVDIESTDTNIDVDDVMQVSFSENEIDHVNTSSAKTEAFYNLWTRKEAFLKATGKGIDEDMKHIPSVDGTHQIPIGATATTKSWIVNSFKIEGGYFAAAATISADTIFLKF